MTIAADIEVPTWVNVRGLTMPEVLVPEVPRAGGARGGWDDRGGPGESWDVEGRRGEIGRGVPVDGTRDPVDPDILVCRRQSNWALALNPVVVVAAVPVVLPLLLEPKLAVPPIVKLEPKSKIGPSGCGMTPVGVSIGDVEGVSMKGKEYTPVTEITSLMMAGREMPSSSPTDAFWALLFACSSASWSLPVPPVVVEELAEAPSGSPNSPDAAMLATPSLRSL